MPTEASTPTPVEAPAAPQTHGDVLKQAAHARAAKRGGGGRAQTATAEAPAVADAAPVPEVAPVAVHEADAGDSVDVEQLKLLRARAVNQARQMERKYREAEQRLKQLEESASKPSVWDSGTLEDKIAEAEKRGLSLRAYTDHVLRKRGVQGVDDPAPQVQASAELEKIRAELAELREARTAESKEREAATQRATVQQELDHISAHAESNDRWGLIKEFGREQMVRDRFYELSEQQGFQPRLQDVMDEVAETLERGTKSLLRHDRVRSLAKADPELFKELRAFFAAEEDSQTEATSADGPAPAKRANGKRTGARPITPAAEASASVRRERGTRSAAERKAAARAILSRQQQR